jgi:penicillin-binding protein 2
VYFYHFAAEMGPAPLIDWTMRFGFGQRTGIDLPDEARGFVPTPTNTSAWSKGSWSPAETRALAIGQSALAVTPLQIARLMAAIANGGRLVTPRIGRGLGLPTGDSNSPADDQDLAAVAPSREVNGLSSGTLAAVRRGLERVVADPKGTAHATVYLDSLSIAGKTGTAETGGGQADHAWFAGYAPADRPKVAFVVVLEHAGGGSDAAGPLARRLLTKMQKLGYFGRGQLAQDATAEDRYQPEAPARE